MGPVLSFRCESTEPYPSSRGIVQRLHANAAGCQPVNASLAFLMGTPLGTERVCSPEQEPAEACGEKLDKTFLCPTKDRMEQTILKHSREAGRTVPPNRSSIEAEMINHVGFPRTEGFLGKWAFQC